MYPYLYKEYRSMSETRVLTSMEEVRTLRVACAKCEAVQEIPATSYKMPSRCFNCDDQIPDKVIQAGEYLLWGMGLVQEVSGSSTIKLQMITRKEE